jgi:hypothetical protein
MGAVTALTANGLFLGQSPAFFALLHELAEAADAAPTRNEGDRSRRGRSGGGDD